MSEIVFDRDGEGKGVFIRVERYLEETKRIEIAGNFLMAKAPDGGPVLVRATEDGRLLTDGQGGGVSSDNFGTIGGVTAKQPNDMLYFVAGTGIQIVPNNETGEIIFAYTGGGSGGDVPDGTLTQKGIVQLSNTVDNDETKAATPFAVSIIKEIALAAGALASEDATTEEKGRVQLYDGIDSDSSTLAATANAVRKAALNVEPHHSTHEIGGSDALPKATGTEYGLTILNGRIDSTASDEAATPSAVKQIADLATQDATTDIKGRVALYTGVDSTRDDLAATAGAVKKANDNGTVSASLTRKGQVQLYSGLDSTRTDLAATADSVRQANVNGTRSATNISPGQVILDTTVNSTDTTKAASASAVREANINGTRTATDQVAGQVKLTDSTISTSITTAATANSVRLAKAESIQWAKDNGLASGIVIGNFDNYRSAGMFSVENGHTIPNFPNGAYNFGVLEVVKATGYLPMQQIYRSHVNSYVYVRSHYDDGRIWQSWKRLIDNTYIETGFGSPEGVVVRPVGAIYQRLDGSTNTTLYVKQSGTGNIGWVAK